MQFLQGLFYFLIMVLIIFGAYVTSRWYASRSMSMSHGKYIKIVDRIALGKDKCIFIMQVGQHIQLMAEDSMSIITLAQLNEADLVALKPETGASSFQDIIHNYLGICKPDTDASNQSFDNLSELKNRVFDSLNYIIKKNKGKEMTHDQEKEVP